MAFHNSLGQAQISRHFLHMLEKKQMPHAFCLVDEEGRGGLILAIDLSFQLLYSQLPASLELGLQHPDLHFVFPVATNGNVKSNPLCQLFSSEWRAFIEQNHFGNLRDWLNAIGAGNKQGNIPVNEISELHKKMHLKPYLGENKVCILWGAERLNEESSNKLLKLIEEPPVNTYFILVVTKENALLPTVKSRCQIITLPPLKPVDIAEKLIENGIDKKQALRISERAEGNYRTALDLSKSDHEQGHLEEHLVACLRLSFHVKKKKTIGIDLMEWTNASSQMSRPNQKAFFSYGLYFMRQAYLHVYQAKELVSFESETGFLMSNFGPYVHGGNIVDLIALFEKSLYAVERNANAKALFADFSLELARLLHRKEN